jgi:hypothetical protein
MLDLFAELAGRHVAAGQRVSRGAGDGPSHLNRRPSYLPAPRRPPAVGTPAPERPLAGGTEWPDGAPEALLSLWTDLAWRHCRAARGPEAAHDPDEHPAPAA